MTTYEVYATGWSNPKVVEQIPINSLEFSMPLNDHGEASFSATVEPGRSFWAQAIVPLFSGVLVTRDTVPVWSGMVWSRRQTGPRTFDFQCAEWGSFFERVPAPTPTVLGIPTGDSLVFSGDNDHYIFRTLIDMAQAISGQNAHIITGTSLGASTSDYTVSPWDDKTTDRAFREIADQEDGPDWYFGAGGTVENPTRLLRLADHMGSTTVQAVLEYVEATEDYSPPASPPEMTVLGNLFPGQQTQAVVGRGGGNVIAAPQQTLDGTASATVAVAIGEGEARAQKRATSVSSLVAMGYPRLTKTSTYSDVKVQATLQRHANADLAAVQGLVAGYTLTTWDGEPDWVTIERGSLMRVILDTDVYGQERPMQFDSRLLDVAVSVRGEGPAQVNWSLATTLET